MDRDPHIIPFLHPIIPFLNSFFDFPLFFEYLPIILIILDDLDMYTALNAWLDACFLGDSVDIDQPYIFYTVWRELGNEDDWAEKADYDRVRLNWLQYVKLYTQSYYYVCDSSNLLVFYVQKVWFSFSFHCMNNWSLTIMFINLAYGFDSTCIGVTVTHTGL